MNEKDLMAEERQAHILTMVNDLGRITVEELVEYFGVSGTTIRRDLSALSKRNLIRRTHGGVMATTAVATTERPILLRQEQHQEDKARIGKVAATFVQNGETLLIAGGSTGLAFAQNLRLHANLTIITDSLLVTNELLAHEQHTVIMLGGMIDPDEQAVRGSLTRLMLTQLRVDKVFIGAKAVSIDRGISAEVPDEAEFLREYTNCGETIFLLTDSSKFRMSALALVSPLEVIDVLITDNKLNEHLSQRIEDLGISVHLA